MAEVARGSVRSSSPTDAPGGAFSGRGSSRVRLAGLGVLVALVFFADLLVAPGSAHELRNHLTGLGFWGPVAMIAIYALLTCAMVPGSVLAGASGLLFGTRAGHVDRDRLGDAGREWRISDRTCPGPAALRSSGHRAG